MTVNYTTNLALGQPVTGTESGTWGDDVNNAVTSYLDIAIAGGLAITVTTADVTLTITQGTSVATNIGSTTAQYAILNVSGAMTAARNLIVPSSSRIYLINNNTTGGFALTVKGSATTGVTLVNGEKAHVFWNGTDYAKLSNASGGAGVFSSITNSGLTSGRVVYSTTGGLETDSANLTFNGTTLTANTIGAFTLSGTIAGGGNQINNVIIGTTTPLAGAFTTLSATGSITQTGANPLVSQLNSGYEVRYAMATGGGAYSPQALAGDAVVASLSGRIVIAPGAASTAAGIFSTTGLAVTGTLTTTGGITSNNSASNGFVKIDGAATGSPYVAFQQSGVDKGLIQYINATSSLDSTVGGGVTKLTTTGLAVTGTLSATGVATFSAGSAAAPAITTTGDTNTGIFFPAADTIAFAEGGAESMRITSAGDVGIGTTTPDIIGYGAGNTTLGTKASATFIPNIQIGTVGVAAATTTTLGDYNFYGLNGGSSVVARSIIRSKLDGAIDATNISFLNYIGGVATERMRIDSSGNLLVGVTSSPSGSGNLSLLGKIFGQASSGAILTLGVGSTSYVTIDGGVNAFYPTTDNATTLGYSTKRWTTVYATTALINTSDANDKQDIADLTDAEIATAKVIKGLFKSFKFKEAVAKKGANARTHIGVMAQDVQAAFAANGLDAEKYGIFCSDTWYEVDGQSQDQEGALYTSLAPNAVEVTKLGIRYEELLAFVIASL